MKYRSPWRMLSSTIASMVLIAGALTLAAPAAQAAQYTLTGPQSAGVSTQVSLTLQGSESNPLPGGTLTLLDGSGHELAYASPDPGALSTTFTFQTPNAVAPLALTAVQDSQAISNAVALNVTAVSTTTTISAPNVATVGQQFTINTLVTSSGGSAYPPPGQVRITDANNATVALIGLTNGPGAGQSFAYYRFTPPTAGTYLFIATYVPAAGSLATASPPSVQDAVIATPSGNTIALTIPPNLHQNTPVTLKANVYPANIQGTVGFTLNGNPISPAVPISNGVASFTWTPNVSGSVTLGANYTTPTGGSGSTTNQVNISAAPLATDVITLVQPGWGPWGNGGSYNMGNGSNFTFQASTLSGAPVTLSETGPCVVSGLNLQVNNGSGVCNMKASSPGGNGYAAVTYSYTVNLVPGVQTAVVSAPASGRYKVGRVLILESPGQQDTNAGQNINWRIKKGGKSVCKLLYPNNGSVTLKIKKKGSCTVLGTAPGVAGQWLKFSTARNYTGR